MPTDQKTGVDGAQTPGGKVADQLKTDSMDAGRNDIFGTTLAEENAAVAKSQALQDQGYFGKQFQKPPGSPPLRSPADGGPLW
jgi:hypothetical protein